MAALVLQVSAVLNATNLGLMLAIVAIGLTLVFGFMEVLNAAHGAFWMIGAYLTWWTSTTFGSFWLSILVVTVAMIALGAAVEIGLLRRVYDLSPLVQLMLTFGLLNIITGLVYIFVGSRGKTVNVPEVFRSSVTILGEAYPLYRLFVTVVAALLILATWALLKFTDVGIAVRASLLDREMARGLGHNIPRIYTIVFVGSVVLAGWAGMLMVPIRGITPTSGLTILLEAFALVIIGGLGSFRGTVVAALMVGFAEVFAVRYISFQLSGLIIYVVLLAVILVRPYGIFGVKQAAEQ
jgi:branched-subunit amino acid ABC-type transport system permease component